jgi:hypothetical protein
MHWAFLVSSVPAATSLSRLRTRELDDIAIGVRQVQGPLSPRTVGRRGQHVHARAAQALVLGVRIVDEEGNLSLRPGTASVGADRPISSGRCGRA